MSIDRLYELSYDECLVFLKTFGKQLDTDIERFFETAMSFKITKQMCKDLEAFQRMDVPHDWVDFDHENQKWNVKSDSNGTDDFIPELEGFISKSVDMVGVSSNVNTNPSSSKTKGVPQSLLKQSKVPLEEGSFEISTPTNGQAQERRSFNPINAIGSKVKNIFTWFKKEKKHIGKENESIDGENLRDSISGHNSHRSADVED